MNRKGFKSMSETPIFITPTNEAYHRTLIEDAREGETNWTISRHAKPGNLILLYVCSPVSAVVAVGTVASQPVAITDPQDPFLGLWRADITELRLMDNNWLPRNLLLRELPDWRYLRMPRNSIQVPAQFAAKLYHLVMGCFKGPTDEPVDL